MGRMIQASEVRHIAKLARLQLADQEVEVYTEQIDRILGFFDQLAALDTSGVPPTSHPLPVANALRADVERASLGVDEVLANAPQPESDMFRVPRILEA